MDARAPDRPVLLYDGLCGFCDRSVQFILARDREQHLRFAALQGRFAEGVLARHPDLAGVDSLILVEHDQTSGGERTFIRSDAVLRIARHLGQPWRALQVLRLVPRFVRDPAYDAFARVRYRVFGRRLTCSIPTPAQRALFVD